MPKSPNPTDKHVGTRVRMRRLMLGLSQTKLADALGITFQQVQKYEKGVNRISASKLQHISSFLQVPIAFFFEGLSDPSSTAKHAARLPIPAHLSEFIATADGLSLIRAYTQITRRTLRHAIVELVEKLASQA
jgi:transcriptional regulator with XRE-family HTH domain